MLPGPLCTQTLADYGAEVIKIEPLTGEFGRIARQDGPKGYSYYFYNVNRNKKCLALDLKKEEGKAVFKELVKDADVVFEQYRPGTMDSLGLGYEELKQINEKIIYCALTGYGQSGPLKMVAGHDINFLSVLGILEATGSREAPGLPGIQIADIAGGTLHAIIAILMALRARELTGKGQYCDVGMLDGCITTMAYSLCDYWSTGRSPQRGMEALNGGLACYQIYETADGKYVSLGALEPKFWGDFCKKINKEEWIGKNMIPKPAMQIEIGLFLTEFFKTKEQKEWVEFFASEDICFSPVLGMEEVVEHPQVVERQLVAQVDDFMGTGKRALFPGLPIKFSETPGEVVLSFGDIGEDSVEVLKLAGYSNEEINEFVAQQVIRTINKEEEN